MKNGDKPAYPISTTEHTGFSPNHEKIYTTVIEGGMTVREVFAMAAMQGIIAGHPDQIHNQTQGATLAVMWADELLKQLDDENTNPTIQSPGDVDNE